MKLSNNFPALIVLTGIVSFVLAIGAMCTAGANAPALDPRIYVEANATATAIAPAIVPTVRYNENVLPTLQAAEASEITETVKNAQEWQRNIDQASGIAEVWVTGTFALGVSLVCIGGGIGLGGWFGARGVREIRAAALPMTRQLAEGPHITEHGTVFHTATGATWAIDEPQDAMPEHARLISPTYQAIPDGVVSKLLLAAASGTASRAEMAQVRYLTE